MPGGIRVRITAVAMLAVTVVLLVTGVALLSAQRRSLTNNLDEILVTHGRNIEETYTAGHLGDPIVQQGDEDAISQVVDALGNVLASTGNFAGQPAFAAPQPGRTAFRTMQLPIDESTYRLMSRSVGGVVIHTGTPIDDVDESVAALRTGLLVAIPAVAVVIGLLIWWLVGRTLRPVEQIRAEVAGIGGASLDRRVPEPVASDEIARLARTMNAMLDRIEGAARREQRFVADASHELRTPLTRMRAELEADLTHAPGADLAATHRSLLDEVAALQRLVDDMLHLARTDSGVGTTRNRPVDLDDLVLAEARRLRTAGEVDVDTTHVAAAQVLGDPEQLERVVRNLCDNAAHHATRRVRLATGERDGRAELTVTDDGPGVSEHDRDRVFERFARVDEARTRSSGGTGLGLAIALEIVTRHGGTITVADAPGGGASFVVSLPLGEP